METITIAIVFGVIILGVVYFAYKLLNKVIDTFLYQEVEIPDVWDEDEAARKIMQEITGDPDVELVYSQDIQDHEALKFANEQYGDLRDDIKESIDNVNAKSDNEYTFALYYGGRLFFIQDDYFPYRFEFMEQIDLGVSYNNAYNYIKKLYNNEHEAQNGQ